MLHDAIEGINLGEWRGEQVVCREPERRDIAHFTLILGECHVSGAAANVNGNDLRGIRVSLIECLDRRGRLRDRSRDPILIEILLIRFIPNSLQVGHAGLFHADRIEPCDFGLFQVSIVQYDLVANHQHQAIDVFLQNGLRSQVIAPLDVEIHLVVSQVLSLVVGKRYVHQGKSVYTSVPVNVALGRQHRTVWETEIAPCPQFSG